MDQCSPMAAWNDKVNFGLRICHWCFVSSIDRIRQASVLGKLWLVRIRRYQKRLGAMGEADTIEILFLVEYTNLAGN